MDWTDFDARDYYESLVVRDAELERGLAQGAFALDNRLRDALRSIRRSDGTFSLPDGAGDLHLPPLTTPEAAALAADAAAGSERDALVKAEGRIRELETRLAAVDSPFRRRLRSLVKSHR